MFRLVLLVLGVLRRMCGTRFNIRNALPDRYLSFAARLRGRSLSFLGSILRLGLLRFVRFLHLFWRRQQMLQLLCDRNKCCLALMNIAAVCQHTSQSGKLRQHHICLILRDTIIHSLNRIDRRTVLRHRRSHC